MCVCVCVCVCACVFHLHSRVWLHLSCRFEYRLQVPGEHCALAAQMQVAESPGCEVVMYNESCLALLLRETVKLPSSISFIVELRLSRMQGLYPDIASTTRSSQMSSSHNYSSEWKSLLPGLSKIEGSVSLLLVTFFLLLSTHPYLER